MTDRDVCLSPKAVARELGVSIQTIYNLVSRGELHALKVGRQYRILRSELDAFKEGNAVDTGDADGSGV